MPSDQQVFDFMGAAKQVGGAFNRAVDTTTDVFSRMSVEKSIKSEMQEKADALKSEFGVDVGKFRAMRPNESKEDYSAAYQIHMGQKVAKANLDNPKIKAAFAQIGMDASKNPQANNRMESNTLKSLEAGQQPQQPQQPAKELPTLPGTNQVDVNKVGVLGAMDQSTLPPVRELPTKPQAAPAPAAPLDPLDDEHKKNTQTLIDAAKAGAMLPSDAQKAIIDGQLKLNEAKTKRVEAELERKRKMADDINEAAKSNYIVGADGQVFNGRATVDNVEGLSIGEQKASRHISESTTNGGGKSGTNTRDFDRESLIKQKTALYATLSKLDTTDDLYEDVKGEIKAINTQLGNAPAQDELVVTNTAKKYAELVDQEAAAMMKAKQKDENGKTLNTTPDPIMTPAAALRKVLIDRFQMKPDAPQADVLFLSGLLDTHDAAYIIQQVINSKNQARSAQ